MPGETPGARLPSPWKDFLGGIDKAPEKPVELDCIGGFGLVFYYGIPRTTGDIDYYTAVPAERVRPQQRRVATAGMPFCSRRASNRTRFACVS
jgi:hypothetical protein